MERQSLRIGTSAFTAAGWEGAFYPPGTKPAEFLSYYATRFDTVEIDSTFYRSPARTTVEGWARKTPPGFLFAAKVPQIITHEKVLVDCDAEFTEFVETMDLLESKLGPLLLQFGYINRSIFPDVQDFLSRLQPFLAKLPTDHQFAIEIRNQSWLVPPFLDLLREHNVALALIDQSWMPRPAQWFKQHDPITANFAYVRWLGDRKEIEMQTKVWNKVIVDRQSELLEWTNCLEKVFRRNVPIYAYANNHYAGYGPSTVEMFRNLWRTQVTKEPEIPPEPEISKTLFPM